MQVLGDFLIGQSSRKCRPGGIFCHSCCRLLVSLSHFHTGKKAIHAAIIAAILIAAEIIKLRTLSPCICQGNSNGQQPPARHLAFSYRHQVNAAALCCLPGKAPALLLRLQKGNLQQLPGSLIPLCPAMASCATGIHGHQLFHIAQDGTDIIPAIKLV